LRDKWRWQKAFALLHGHGGGKSGSERILSSDSCLREGVFGERSSWSGPSLLLVSSLPVQIREEGRYRGSAMA